MTTPSQPAANTLSLGPAVQDGQRTNDPAVPATAARQDPPAGLQPHGTTGHRHNPPRRSDPHATLSAAWAVAFQDRSEQLFWPFARPSCRWRSRFSQLWWAATLEAIVPVGGRHGCLGWDRSGAERRPKCAFFSPNAVDLCVVL